VDGSISRPSPLIRADQHHLAASLGDPDLAADGIEGPRTVRARQTWLYRTRAAELLGRAARPGDVDGILGPETTRLHQHALNLAAPGSGRY
jgi:peptidoglycan hydrolase-like protein with peptidoglycan-binding domain